MLILGIVCIVLAVVLATRLLRGAKDVEVPVRPAPLNQGNETYPRLHAVSVLREGDAGVGGDRDYTAPTLTGRAAKGFNRDQVIGRDVLQRADRQWTQPMNHKDMH
jgi:hypothetical protein